MTVIDAYRELIAFVLGSAEEARLWLLWHAYLLQHPLGPRLALDHPDRSGLGQRPDLAPGSENARRCFISVSPSVLTSQFNGYAEKHLIGVNEMRETGRDAYTLLKAIARS
jgi:hypothetical protein